jgi:integrase
LSGSGKALKGEALTVTRINGLKPSPDGPYRLPDARTAGLGLRIAQDGGKTWDLQFRISGTGKVRRVSLGRYGDPGAGLEEARNRARAIVSAARQGFDLLAQEHAAKDEREREMTVATLRELYLAREVRGRLRTAFAIERKLTYALASIDNLKISEVRKRDLRPLLEAIKESGRERTAEKLRQYLTTMFKWAVSLDYLTVSPASGLAAYSKGVPRDRILTENEIRILWAWLDRDSTLATEVIDALEVQFMLGARIGEITGMMVDELDRSDKVWLWTLPGKRSKNKRARVTPIIGLAREILERRLQWVGNDGVLFPNERGRPLVSARIGTALAYRRHRFPEGLGWFGSHDLRRTAVSMMDEMGISRELIGAIVGHSVDDQGRSVQTLLRHYLKSDLLDRKRVALERWDARVREILSGEPTEADGKVIRPAFAQRRP